MQSFLIIDTDKENLKILKGHIRLWFPDHAILSTGLDLHNGEELIKTRNPSIILIHLDELNMDHFLLLIAKLTKKNKRIIVFSSSNLNLLLIKETFPKVGVLSKPIVNKSFGKEIHRLYNEH